MLFKVRDKNKNANLRYVNQLFKKINEIVGSKQLEIYQIDLYFVKCTIFQRHPLELPFSNLFNVEIALDLYIVIKRLK